MARVTPWSLLPCIALTACVQILGIEEAKLDEGTQNGGSASGFARSSLSCEQEPGPSCGCDTAPQPECKQCLDECGEVPRCAGDARCRAELDAYAICLGESCGGDQEQCARAISDPVFGVCVSTCANACQRTKLLSPCELYCACMSSYCESELAPAGLTDCMATCESLDADVRDCRRDHCEWGRGAEQHCRHASNRDPVCDSQLERPIDDRTFCTTGKESTWACDDHAECCSESCRGGACE